MLRKSSLALTTIAAIISAPCVYSLVINCEDKNTPSTDCCTGGPITLNQDITTIPANAFVNCVGLTGNLSIPSSVTSIGDVAFQWTSISSVSFNGLALTSIGSQAFNQFGIVMDTGSPTLVGSIIIPDSVTSIGDSSFYDAGISSLDIGTGVQYIGHGSFGGCNRLRTIIIRSTAISTFGSDAFLYVCEPFVEVIFYSQQMFDQWASSVFGGCTVSVRAPTTAAPTTEATNFITQPSYQPISPSGRIPKPYSMTSISEGVTTTTIKIFSQNTCTQGVIDGRNVVLCDIP